MRDPTERFSDRVDDYVRYRPSYPRELVDLMRVEMGLRPDHTVADVGSGTGILSTLLLAHGNAVIGVEPNRAMREAAEHELRGEPRFTSVDGSAEQTGLPDASVEFVTAGQAFHWFETEEASAEFRRILRPSGWVLLVWNTRRLGGTPFLDAYEAFVTRWGTDYATVRESYVVEAALREMFPEGHRFSSFPNEQILDADGFRGRMLSSSYVPGPEHPDRRAILDGLGILFERHQVNGLVRVEYDTTVYYGQI